jgi:tetratricopeptide (TPR) repeat protein
MSQRPSVYYSNEVAPPPRLLRWLVIFLVVSVALVVIAVPLGIYAFREWVPPRYQFVYSERFPILQVILPPRPDADATIPMPSAAATSSVPLEALLGAPVIEGVATEEAAATEAVTEDVTEEAEAEGEASAGEAVVMLPSPTLPGPTATMTVPPTATPMNTAVPTAAPPTDAPPQQAAAAQADVLADLNVPRPPANARNFGFQYITQTWNNCGPANATMSLSYYGWREDQAYAQRFLRGGREDKNVSPDEIVDFVNAQTQVRALYRIGGDVTTLKRLVAAEFPVMIELGYAPEGNDWLGHYQTVVGYDDAVGAFYVFDSYIPSDQGLPESYREFDSDWQQFSRTFIVFYPPEREQVVMDILGELETADGAHEVALATAQREARENPNNPYPWFNIGKAQTRLGNYEAAASAFDQARLKGLPWRMLWYQFEPFEAYFETGRYSDVLALVESNITTLGNGYVEETFYWEGRVYEAQGESSKAAAAFRQAIQQNSSFEVARTALERVS